MNTEYSLKVSLKIMDRKNQSLLFLVIDDGWEKGW